MKIEANKWYKLRDGRKAFVSCIRTDGVDAAFPAIGYIEGVSGGAIWACDGEYVYGQKDDRDIIGEWKEPKTMWFNVHKDKFGSWFVGDIFNTRDAADNECGSKSRIACVKITEGEGL